MTPPQYDTSLPHTLSATKSRTKIILGGKLLSHLWDHIYIVISACTQMSWGFVFPSKPLPQLVKVERGGIPSIVVISIHVQHLEAVDGEEAAEDALLEARPEHDHVVLLIHGSCSCACSVAAAGGGSKARTSREEEAAAEEEMELTRARGGGGGVAIIGGTRSIGGGGRFRSSGARHGTGGFARRPLQISAIYG
jgi:hypothetical protein